jgi:hypothetical protein
MLHDVLALVLAAVLIASAGLKLAAPRASANAIESFGLRAAWVRWAALGAAVLAESVLAAGIALGSFASDGSAPAADGDLAAFAAAGLMAAFAVAHAAALARGRRGAPCACFGGRSTITPGSLARCALLAASLVVLPAVPRTDPSVEAWLAAGLAIAALAIAGLAVAVLALAREVGILRMALGPQQALEIPSEGPPLGEPAPLLLARADPSSRARLALAVFASEGCRMCQAVAPAVAMLAREDDLAVVVLDEVADADAWTAAAIPGSPYAVALDPVDGTVLAKGTFNGLGQLESVLATAARRAESAGHTLELLHG